MSPGGMTSQQDRLRLIRKAAIQIVKRRQFIRHLESMLASNWDTLIELTGGSLAAIEAVENAQQELRNEQR